MCTWIVQTAKLSGSGKAAGGWIPVTKANVCYDHPAHAFMEHSLNIDFVNEARGRTLGLPWRSARSRHRSW